MFFSAIIERLHNYCMQEELDVDFHLDSQFKSLLKRLALILSACSLKDRDYNIGRSLYGRIMLQVHCTSCI